MKENYSSPIKKLKKLGAEVITDLAFLTLGFVASQYANNIIAMNKLDLNHDGIEDIRITTGIPKIPIMQRTTYILGTPKGNYKPLLEIKNMEIEKAKQQIEMKYDSLIKEVN